MATHILVVDDETAIADLVEVYLKNEGFPIHKFYNASDALACVRTTRLNLAVLDVMLPDIDGFTPRPRISGPDLFPIIMLTAKVEDMDKIMGLTLGADDYLTKPFASQELLARIRAMTREQTAQTTSQLHVGNVTLDRATFELSTPSGSLRLANKEFQMLELLMCNPRNLISTERFLEKIWGYDNEAEINVVWVYISYLRKKLAALHSNVQIKARRNVGYSMEEIS